ncbi:YceI family protein [Mycetocola reblochoni]|uniref:Protein yceI n=2 Tax=Mycetocola reblochoni TaxID=331618 RepID=A0A1R4JEV9_9MICO|nr:YceI family protein [Mycetocola reblochoni]RLP69912.1 polyisoprenoid-binding protein [Mycetocola reblochoni]SJN30293.1 Protein yceI precursor [Mycetocola reblochoni REB411]
MVTAAQIPGYTAGTWKLDPVHSTVTFSIRHLMVSKVRGSFTEFDATIVTGEEITDSSVTASVTVASVNTGEPNRDGHLRTGDFFDAETYPTIDFHSTAVRSEKNDVLVDGDLTLRGVTKPVTFTVEVGGFAKDFEGNVKAGATATTTIKRGDFGLNYNAALETGGVLLGDDVTITLDLQGTLQG